jgi:hypothetical protein
MERTGIESVASDLQIPGFGDAVRDTLPCASSTRASGDRTLGRAAVCASERLREIHESVIHLERAPTQDDRPGHAHRIDSCVCVTELCVQPACCEIRFLADAETDAFRAPAARFLLGCMRELGCDPTASSFGHDVDVVDLGKTQVRADPSDVRMPDGPIVVSCDEVG